MVSRGRGAPGGLTGGTDAVDGIDGIVLNESDLTFGIVESSGAYKIYPYALDDNSAAAESSPNTISPDNNAGDKRHILATLSVKGIQLLNQAQLTDQSDTQLLPTGTVVGTSDSQTLTNKTIDADNNTLSNLEHGAEVDQPSSGVHGVTGSVVGTSDAQALTNKTGLQLTNGRVLTDAKNLELLGGATYWVDPAETDQGATGNGRSIKALADSIGSSKRATLRLIHTGDSNETTYTLTTSFTITSNIILEADNGVIIDGAGTLTINSPFKHSRCQVFGSSITVEGLEYAFAEWFGAAADPSTPIDDRDEFNSAFTAISSKGGSVYLDPKGQYYIASSFTIPAGCSLIGNPNIQIPETGVEWETMGCLIYLNSSAKITLSESCSISGVKFLRYGIVLRANAAEVGNYAGTCLYLADGAHNVYIGHCGIGGFQTGVDNYVSGSATLPASFNYCNNLRVEYCLIDGVTGIRIGNALNLTWFESVEMWPWMSNGGVAADNERTGYGFHIAGGSDGVMLNKCFVYAYGVGFRIEAADQVILEGCGYDGPASPSGTPYAFQIIGDDTKHCKLIGCYSWGNPDFGVEIDNAVSNYAGVVHVIGCDLKGSDSALRIVDGMAIMTGSNIRGSGNGVRLGADADLCMLDNNNFYDNDYVISTHANFDDKLLILGDNFYSTINTAFTDNWTIPQVASAATIAIPYGHNIIEVTGTTGITSITATHPEHEITLKFAAGVTVTDGSNLKLSGNFNADADDTLTLVCDGTNWYERSRSAN